MKHTILTIAASLSLAGCVTTQPPAASSAPAAQTQAPACIQNFAKTGSSLMPSRTRYSTQALITGVSRDDAGLVANFTNVPRGVRVRLDFKMAFGQAASDSNMQDNLCGVINAILTGG